MQAQGIVDRERLKLQLETQQEAVLAMVKEEMIRERINEDVRLRAVHAEVFIPFNIHLCTHLYTRIYIYIYISILLKFASYIYLYMFVFSYSIIIIIIQYEYCKGCGSS
jgi:hypothetical protein